MALRKKGALKTAWGGFSAALAWGSPGTLICCSSNHFAILQFTRRWGFTLPSPPINHPDSSYFRRLLTLFISQLLCSYGASLCTFFFFHNSHSLPLKLTRAPGLQVCPSTLQAFVGRYQLRWNFQLDTDQGPCLFYLQRSWQLLDKPWIILRAAELSHVGNVWKRCDDKGSAEAKQGLQTRQGNSRACKMFNHLKITRGSFVAQAKRQRRR